MTSAPPQSPDKSGLNPTARLSSASVGHKTHQVPLFSPATYPHIWDLILEHVDLDSPECIALRDTCSTLRDIICCQLYGRVAAWHLPVRTDDLKFDDGPLQLFALDNGSTIPGLDWNGGDLQRQLCIDRLNKYCKRFAYAIDRNRVEASKSEAELALLGSALSGVEALRVHNPNRPLFNYPHVHTVVGFSEINRASMDFQEVERWAIDTDEPPEDREELAPIILNPHLVPPSTKTIVYHIRVSDSEVDHGNNNLVVKTDLAALKDLGDLAFVFDFDEGMFGHRPNNFKPLGVLNTLVRSVASAVPHVRLTFKGLEWYHNGWFCGPGIPEDDIAAWTEYMRRYIAQYILWVQTEPGTLGETYFKWEARIRGTDEESSVAAALQPILDAVFLERRDESMLCGSDDLYDFACRAPPEPEARSSYLGEEYPVQDDANRGDYFEILDNHGDDDYDGFWESGADRFRGAIAEVEWQE